MTRYVAIDVKAEADFDSLRQNRFVLRRTWNDSLPKVGFCLTNPSKAGGHLDDPTSLKLQMYARLWNYGGIILVNGFSWCATNLKDLRTRIEDAETIKMNNLSITSALDACEIMVCGWGRNGLIDGRAHKIRLLLRPYAAKIKALRIIKSGEPEHPLYLPLHLAPIPYDVITDRRPE
jgi:hypothetical protein